MYREDTFNTNQSGLEHRRVEQKCVIAYENQIDEGRCLVKF